MGGPMRDIHVHFLRPVGRCTGFLVALLLLVLTLAPAGIAQTSVGPSQPLITQAINEGDLAVLAGNTRPEVNAANDRGIVPDSLPLPGLMLQLRRPAAQEQALTALIDQLHDPNSPNFHHWINASQLGAQFGPAASDIQTITGWLQQQGFTVNAVYPNRMVIDFSATAGQIRTAFHTEIHNLEVNGVAHIANMTDPQIPAALAPAVVGIVSLHDFKPKPQYTGPCQDDFGAEITCYIVTPSDLATIYNFNPLFGAGITGKNQSIYVVDLSAILQSDWTTFRSTFGLSGHTGGSINPNYQPPGAATCTPPGLVSSGQDEATLDAEWSSAAAPDAAIYVAACTNPLAAVQNLVNSPNPPAIMSVSLGQGEACNGASTNAMENVAFQTGAAGGMSIFVSAGDHNAAMCDQETSAATHGISVNGIASSPYVVAVGGTDFADTAENKNSTYWNSSNGSTNGSAKSYMPEIPWNGSCGSQISATYFGFNTTYGSTGFCNSSTAVDGNYITVVGGAGGPSACATGSPATAGVVSGSCAGYAKPSWQTGFAGIQNDGVRDLPDVSMFAADLNWLHAYVYYESGSTTAPYFAAGYNLAGGTSFGAPIWAGIQALINQKAGGKQGLPNYQLYKLAAGEYGAGGSSSCNSSNGNTVASSCIFYDVTLGDNDADCTGSINCYLPSGTVGVMSTSNSSYQPAFKATTGWDFATGIGTPNVNNLVTNWQGGCSGCGVVHNTHDFNGDGYSDIAWRNSNGDVSIWLMNGTQVLSAPDVGNVPTSWTMVGQRQLNDSGFADLIWRNTDGDVAIWLMNGSQILSAPDLANVPANWTIVGTGPYNGTNGYAELFWRDTAGDLAIWQINGTQILAAPILGNVPTSWTIAGTGDFSGTGNTDILWRNADGDVAIWFMNGVQVVSSPDIGNVPTSWTIVGTGDFNGDGKTDILWRNANGDVSIWLMNGTQVLSAPDLGNVPASWTIAETGDFNGDGHSDILWRNSNGDVSIWFMNGTQILSSPDFVNVPTSWTIQGANAD